jgi:hypothetical protein
MPVPFQGFNAASAASVFTADIEQAVPIAAGADAGEWDYERLMQPPYFPAAFAEARRRIPCDWSLLDASSQGWLQLALIQYTAALIVPAVNPGRTEDVKIGNFSLKTDDTLLLASQGDLFGQAAVYFANVVLPPGIVPVPQANAFPRRMAGRSNIGRATVCGTARRSLF